MFIAAISSDRSEYMSYGRFNIRDNSESASRNDSLQKKDNVRGIAFTDKYDEKTRQKIEELKKIDREVRLHEQMHLSAAGPYARGGATFQYTTGPDGKKYATSGEVSIDTSEIPNNPRATITKAQVIRRAALAPAEPSAQDRTVAAEATQMEMKAKQELLKQESETARSYTKDGKKAETAPESPVFDFHI
ncbi:MAG: putative metalloprotease CJM1_0395 family protein [Candidatus Eremiobacterota bacterium]